MKAFKIILGIFLGIILMGAAAFLFMVAMPIHNGADHMGEDVGQSVGQLVGYAVGTYKGITEKAAEGWEDGKEKGLSAEDTDVTIDEIKTLGKGKLEVLSADISINNIPQISDDYAALYVRPGNVIFSIDLSQTVVTKNSDGTYTVTAPSPEAELFLKEDKAEKIAEYIKYPFTGKVTDGIEANVNARAEVLKRSIEELSNYAQLLEDAKEFAKKQIVLILGPGTQVVFKEGE